MKKLDDILLALVVLLAALAMLPQSCGNAAPTRVLSQAPRFTPRDALEAARACVHEATWAGGVGGSADCGGIIQVVETRRRTDESFLSALHRTMPRFAAHSTDRSWVHFLETRVMRDNPPGWPFNVGVQHYDSAWHSVYRRVTGFMHGTEALPCEPDPVGWFGRETDSHALAARLATGLWREAVCGETHNAFIYPLDPE